MKLSKIALLVWCGFFSMSAVAALYKWVDDNGETHYGEVVPPEYANKDKVQFDDKGRVIKAKPAESNTNVVAGNSAEQKAALEQRRKDKALLNTYSNEKEIDLARDRNLQLVEARIKNIEEMQKSAQEDLDSYRKEAKDAGAGKAIPASIQVDISAAESRIAKLKQDMDVAKAKAESVRAAFEADKARYRELIGGGIKK
jgi:hypothetical protein